MKGCLICFSEDNSCEKGDPEWWRWQTCSQTCFLILTKAINHKNTPCWISQEVNCQKGYCSSDDGVCEILKLEKQMKKLSSRELILSIGEYFPY